MKGGNKQNGKKGLIVTFIGKPVNHTHVGFRGCRRIPCAENAVLSKLRFPVLRTQRYQR